AGKSTLVSLLVRAIDPTSGTVTLDGRALPTLNLEKLRSNVSIVVETPTRLDDRQRELLAELARLRGEDDVEPVRDSSVIYLVCSFLGLGLLLRYLKFEKN
ncbi:MAG: ATP-binding cassette domain-containing protein, partial [Neisseria elongata]